MERGGGDEMLRDEMGGEDVIMSAGGGCGGWRSIPSSREVCNIGL